MTRRIAVRVARVAERRQADAVDVEVRRLAAYLGIPEAEVRAGADAVERLCRAADAFSPEARVAAVAADLGIPAADVWAEVAALREAVDATR